MWQTISLAIAGCFGGVACLISGIEIYLHLTNYHQPPMQRLIIRILLMVPVYAIDSFLSLVMIDAAIYWNTLRNCYEAFVLYSFFTLLLTYMGGGNTLLDKLKQEPVRKHLFPICCFPHFKPNAVFLRRTQQGVLQFVLVKVLTTIASLIMNFCGVFDEGQFSVQRGYLYVTIIDNISITISMYCLVLFYQVTKELLQPFRPMGKFLCIKAVIFLSFWQGVAVALLAYFDVIQDIGDWSAHNVGLYLQNFLICIEMMFAAVAHHWVFAWSDYIGDGRTSLLATVKSTMHVRDVMNDTVTLFVPRAQREPRGRYQIGSSYGTLADQGTLTNHPSDAIEVQMRPMDLKSQIEVVNPQPEESA